MNGLMRTNNNLKRSLLMVLLIVFCLSQSGCALLNLPFKVLDTVLDIVRRLPKPPPGVF